MPYEVKTQCSPLNVTFTNCQQNPRFRSSRTHHTVCQIYGLHKTPAFTAIIRQLSRLNYTNVVFSLEGKFKIDLNGSVLVIEMDIM